MFLNEVYNALYYSPNSFEPEEGDASPRGNNPEDKNDDGVPQDVMEESLEPADMNCEKSMETIMKEEQMILEGHINGNSEVLPEADTKKKLGRVGLVISENASPSGLPTSMPRDDINPLTEMAEEPKRTKVKLSRQMELRESENEVIDAFPCVMSAGPGSQAVV